MLDALLDGAIPVARKRAAFGGLVSIQVFSDLRAVGPSYSQCALHTMLKRTSSFRT